MNKLKSLYLLLGIVFFVTQTPLQAKSKTAHEVFGYLIKKQQLFDVMPVASLADNIEEHVRFVFEKYKNERSYTSVLEALLKSFGYKGDFSDPSKIVLDESVKLSLKSFYAALDHDIPTFIEMLKKLGFANRESNEQEEKLYDEGKSSEIVNRYKIFMHLLLAQKDEIKELEYFFTVGSNFFNYCYSEETNKQFLDLLKDKSNHSIGRLLYSVLWWALSGTGWRYWQVETLRNLKKEADQGKEIMYLAGGNDLYHLVKKGVYTITIIDPELPTQPKYYTHGWEWLIKGEEGDGLGDEIVFTFWEENKRLILRRTKFKEGEPFVARLAEGEQVTIKKSITQWSVYEGSIDPEECKFSPMPGREKDFPVLQQTSSVLQKAWKYVTSFFSRSLGTITFDRRPLVQKDFTYDRSRVFLMSFNEIFYIALKDWGIDPEKIDDGITIYNKQVRYSMTRQQMLNIAEAFKADFHFIRLGSCVN